MYCACLSLHILQLLIISGTVPNGNIGWTPCWLGPPLQLCFGYLCVPVCDRYFIHQKLFAGLADAQDFWFTFWLVSSEWMYALHTDPLAHCTNWACVFVNAPMKKNRLGIQVHCVWRPLQSALLSSRCVCSRIEYGHDIHHISANARESLIQESLPHGGWA